MEILYLVVFTVVVAVAAMVHTNPYDSQGFGELGTTAGEFR